MECNKDEAQRSKEIAEAKFLARDYAGARRFLQKAQHLYPELDGILQFVYVLDVHVASQQKLEGGESNWYGILQIELTADESTIRKQYRKLALLLHPDKNKAVGAEAAFKHISEAWSVLSDKLKKAAYDIHTETGFARTGKSHSRPQHEFQCYPMSQAPSPELQPDHPSQHQTPSPPQPRSHYQYKSLYSQSERERDYHQAVPLHHPCGGYPPRLPTFWTACPSCRMQLEYPSVYVDQNLCCPLCYKPFFSREIIPHSGILLWEQGGFMANTVRNAPSNGNKSNLPGSRINAGKMAPSQLNKMTSKESSGTASHKIRVGKLKTQRKLEREEIKARAAAHAKEQLDRLIAKSKGVIEQRLAVAQASSAVQTKRNGSGCELEKKGLQDNEALCKFGLSQSLLSVARGERGKGSVDCRTEDDLPFKKQRLYQLGVTKPSELSQGISGVSGKNREHPSGLDVKEHTRAQATYF